MKIRKSLFKKILLISVIFFLVIFSTVIFLYKIYITPSFIEKNLRNILQKSFPTKIEFTIKEISLLRGIEIRDLIIYNPSYSSKSIFFSIKKLRIKYNLFHLFFLQIKFDEILIDQPYIFLEYYPKRGVWNFSSFLPPETSKVDKEQRGPLQVNFDLKKFTLNNFQLEFIKDFYISLKNINLFFTIDLDKLDISGINKLNLKIFNSGKENLVFKNKDIQFIIPLELTMNLNIPEKKKGTLYFNYQLNKQLVEMKKKFINIPDLNFLINSEFNLEDFTFNINEFVFAINKNYLINLKGKIVKINKNLEFKIVAEKNNLDVNTIEDLLRIMFNRETLKVNGNFKTDNFILSKESKSKNPTLSSTLVIKNINFDLPQDNLFVRSFNLKMDVNNTKFNTLETTITIFMDRLVKNALTIEDFNALIKIIIKRWGSPPLITFNINKCDINGGYLTAHFIYQAPSLQGNMKLQMLDVNQFNPNISGHLNLLYSIRSSTSLVLNNDVDMSITNFKFTSQVSNKRFDSKNIPLALNTKITINPKNKQITIPSFYITMGDIMKASFHGAYDRDFLGELEFFKIKTDALLSILPENMMYDIPFEHIKGDLVTYGDISYKEKGLSALLITTNSGLTFEQKNAGIKIKNLFSRLEFKNLNNQNNINYFFSISNIENKVVTYNSNKNTYDIFYSPVSKNLTLKVLAHMYKDEIKLNNLDFNIPDLNVHMNVKGLKSKTPNERMHFLVDLNFSPEKRLTILNNIDIQGILKLNSSFYSDNKREGSIIEGLVLFKDFSFETENFEINNINGNLPFRHIYSTKIQETQRLMASSSDKDFQILNYPLNKIYKNIPDNLLIQRIKVNAMTMNNISFDMNYKDNFLALQKVYMELLEGSLSINNSYLDLANLKPENFRYQFNLEVSGIDIIKLKPIKINKGEDTTIFANMRFKGRGINVFKSGDIMGSFNVTHIGRELASKFLESLDPEQKDSGMSRVRFALESGARPELLSLELKYGQLFSKMWIKESFLYRYILFMIPRLPPSPIEFEPKSIDVLMKSFKIKN